MNRSALRVSSITSGANSGAPRRPAIISATPRPSIVSPAIASVSATPLRLLLLVAAVQAHEVRGSDLPPALQAARRLHEEASRAHIPRGRSAVRRPPSVSCSASGAGTSGKAAATTTPS
jgi:hypothetical protein